MNRLGHWTLENDSRIPDEFSQYAVVFDSTSLLWKDDMESNEKFLNEVVCLANAKLKKYGYLFLSDIMFLINKLELVRKARPIWWTFEGDGFVKFELFKDPEGKFIVIDFNVDGVFDSYAMLFK